MPEWAFDLKVNFYAPDDDYAAELAQAIGEQIFVLDDVNSVEAPFGPVWVKDDDA